MIFWHRMENRLEGIKDYREGAWREVASWPGALPLCCSTGCFLVHLYMDLAREEALAGSWSAGGERSRQGISLSVSRSTFGSNCVSLERIVLGSCQMKLHSEFSSHQMGQASGHFILHCLPLLSSPHCGIGFGPLWGSGMPNYLFFLLSLSYPMQTGLGTKLSLFERTRVLPLASLDSDKYQ